MTQADAWKLLYLTGAIAALIAALLFRRNIGAEVSLFTGVTLNLSSNISLTMFSLSQRYNAATSAAQRTDLLVAGQSILAGNDPLAAIPGTGALVSLLLVALAGLLFAVLLLPTHRVTAIIGLLASGCDLAYCLIVPLTPVAPVYLLLASAGLFWMLWHLLVARILFQRVKE